jgi:uncharacterized protein YjbJ (UPF0337 family)
MNRDQIEGMWKELKGRVIEQWYRLSDDRSGMLAGQRQQIAGRMQKGYGRATERSVRQLNEWRKSMRNAHVQCATLITTKVAGGTTDARLHLVRP